MINRNKIIMTLVIVLVCSSVTFVLWQKEGRSTASDMGMPHAKLPLEHQTAKSDSELASELGNDSIYDRLSNNTAKGEAQLLFYKDSLIALSRQVADSTILPDNSDQEKDEMKYEVIE